MARFLKYALSAVKWLFLALFLAVGSLFFRDQRLPQSWVERITDRVSTPEVLVRCDRAAIGFRHGLSLRGLRVYDRARTNGVAVIASASSISVNPLRHEVRIVGARYPRLPDSYYEPGFTERNEPLEVTLPDLPEFRLVLERPSILGLEPERVTAQVLVRRSLVSLDEAHVEWPGRSPRIAEDGFFRLDLASQWAHGEVRGVATQRHIRPLIETLDIPCALPYFDAFTEVPAPVNASGEFTVNLVNNDFRMRLDLRPEMGRYNGVAMSRAEGILDLTTETRGTNCKIRLKVDLPMALDAKGRQLAGSLAVNLTNEFVRLDYNAVSKLDFDDILRIADFIDPETLAAVATCETAPEITAVGHTGTCAEDAGWNALAGSGRLWRGAVLGFRVRNLSFDYALAGEDLSFTNVRATGKDGGSVQGEARVFMPGFDEDRMTFSAQFDHTGGSLDELADVLGFDLAGRNGRVDASFDLAGAVVTNVAATLNGAGRVRITDGHLLQLKLFAGLTEQLANWVPGVEYLVNQSQASVDFTVTNGVFRTENLYIEGGLLSIKGWGTYDAGLNDIDATVRVQFLKNESFLGSIVHPLTWPFTKLLLEFHASGPVDNPKWDYISLLDRVF